MELTQNKQAGSTSATQSDALAFLREAVGISSATHNIEGVKTVQKMVRRRLQAIGLQTKLIPHPKGESAPLLIGRYDCGAEKTISLVCHADTVFDSKRAEVHRISEVGGHLIGPGVADNKGGITVALWGLQKHLEKGEKNVNIQFVCSPNEETGSHGFTELFGQLGAESEFVLGFEPSTENGDIINCRAGNRWYTITTLGIEAHAGRANGEEINAAHELMFKLNAILDLKSEYPDLKVNVAQLSGGKDRYNIVCGNASAKIDIRYARFDTRDEVHDRIVNIVNTPYLHSNDGQPSHSTWLLDDDCPPLQKNESSRAYSDMYKDIIEKIEARSIRAKMVGGAADVNYLSQPNNISLCGLGPVGGKMHTENEFIEVASLQSRSDALSLFLSSIR